MSASSGFYCGHKFTVVAGSYCFIPVRGDTMVTRFFRQWETLLNKEKDTATFAAKSIRESPSRQRLWDIELGAAEK